MLHPFSFFLGGAGFSFSKQSIKYPQNWPIFFSLLRNFMVFHKAKYKKHPKTTKFYKMHCQEKTSNHFLRKKQHFLCEPLGFNPSRGTRPLDTTDLRHGALDDQRLWRKRRGGRSGEADGDKEKNY